MIAVMLAPFVPDASERMLAAVGAPAARPRVGDAAPGPAAGGRHRPSASGPLFPRVDEPLGA